MKEWDEKWGEVPMKALLKSRLSLHPTARAKLSAILQREILEEMVMKEARGWIRRWKNLAEGDGKPAELGEMAIRQVGSLRGQSTLKRALAEVEEEER